MCEISWIDKNGKPTPDSNPAIGRVRCKLYQYERFGGARKPWAGDYSAWFSICAEHAKTLAEPDMKDWEFWPLKDYEVTFVHQNEDWTWIYVQAADFHDAMAIALDEATKGHCRVHSIMAMTPEQVAANKASMAARKAV